MRKKYQTANGNYDLLEKFALENRKNPTVAESVLWEYLKGGLMGEHFRRQHVLLDYIPDFVCLSKKVVIEIDGGYHLAGEQPERDAERAAELSEQGFAIIRFTNEEVINHIDKVLETITNTLEHTPDHVAGRSNHLPSLREGSGVGLTIIKVGGAVVEDDAQLERLLRDFSAIEGRKVLVHGGGRKATKMAERLGIETLMVQGRRVTDAAMLEVVTMVYGGLVNKQLVARLQACGVNAIGLTGADANVIRSHKRPPVVVASAAADGLQSPPLPSGEGGGGLVDYGFVGDVDRVDGMMLANLIEQGLVPVVAPLTHDGEGQMLNTNADTMAQEVATALAPHYDVTLVYAFEKPGVLRRADDDQSVIPVITRADFDRYRADGTIGGGMLPKVENALRAVEAGVVRVIITRADAIDGRHGTVIR